MPKQVLLSKRRLIDMLKEANLLTENQVNEIIELQRKEGKKLQELLITHNYLTTERLRDFLAEELEIEKITLDEMLKISPEIIKSTLPENFLRINKICPLMKDENTLTVAMSDPLNVYLIDEMKNLTKLDIKVKVATEADIDTVLEKVLGRFVFSMEKLVDSIEIRRPLEEEALIDIKELEREAEDAPVVALVNYILGEAIRLGASDIHIEPYEDYVRTRYRIDGLLYEMNTSPKKVHNPMVSRIKILSALNIAERRLPQDGRCKLRMENREIDLRVSTMPTTFGEKVALRILDAASLCLDLEALGFEKDTLKVYEKLIHSPHGMILVTGPTGSGKSTTLYSTLNTINSPTLNIITIEDPVEYLLKGINQVQVKPEIGLDFASALRTFVRQDPDIIMVGEIRDRETAEVAINAAMTGHLVFSTLHTNDAAGAVTRLINMGIEPFLITSTLICVIAQRLVRKICPKCKTSYEVSPIGLSELKLKAQENLRLYKGEGCQYCSYIGYKGRTGIFELLVMNDEIRSLVLNRESSHIIKEAAKKVGMKTLREVATEKMLRGITTAEEVLRVSFEEEMGSL